MATGGQYTSTKGTTNYARICRLLTDVCADVLREVIDVYIPLPQLPHSLIANRATLWPLLNYSQKQLLYPPGLSCCPPYALMDISLLYVLIRNISRIPAPNQGWGKDPISRANDNTLASNVERIRIKRNKLSGHLVTASVSDLEFHQHWQEIEDTLMTIEASDLGGGTRYKDAMDDLLQQCIDPEMEQRYGSELRRIELADQETKQVVETYGEHVKQQVNKLQGQVHDVGENLSADVHRVGAQVHVVGAQVLDVREILSADVHMVGARVHDLGENLGADVHRVHARVHDVGENLSADVHRVGARVHDVGENLGADVRGVGAQVHDVGENLSADVHRVGAQVHDVGEVLSAVRDLLASSTTDTNIQRLWNYTSSLIQSHRNSRTFHRTQMCDTVLTTLLEQNFLTLKAPAGFGKTTIALDILSSLETKYPGRPVFCVRSPEEWKLVNGLKTPIIVWCDDIFGATNFNSSLLENWKSFLYDMYLRSASGDVLLLLGIRTHILAEANESVKSYDIFQHEHVVDLALLEMSIDDRKLILINYIKASNICELENEGGENSGQSRDAIIITTEIVDNISKLPSVPALGYPQCVKLYTSSKHLIEQKVNFFITPLEGLADELKFIRQTPSKYLTLVLALLKDDTIHVDNLTEDNEMLCMLSKVCGISPPISPDTVTLEADRLTDVYFLYEDRTNTYTISHQSVKESLAVVFGDQWPRELLTYCPLSVLRDLVRTYDYDKKLGEVVLKIRPTMYSVMVDRLLSEIIRGHGEELRFHQCFTDKQFLDVLFDSRRQTQLQTALYTRQGQLEYSFMLYVVSYLHAERCQFVERAVTGPGALFSPLTATRGDEKWVRIQVQFALISACYCGHANIVRLLTEAWPRWDWGGYRNPWRGGDVSDWRCVCTVSTPLTTAALYDKPDLTNWLLDQDCDATVRDELGNTVLHYLCIHGRSEILTRVLTRHDGRAVINMSNKVGWTCVHFAALTGRDAVVTELLKHGADVTVATSDTRQTPLQLCLEGLSSHDKDISVTFGGIKALWNVFTKYSSKKQFDATITLNCVVCFLRFWVSRYNIQSGEGH